MYIDSPVDDGAIAPVETNAKGATLLTGILLILAGITTLSVPQLLSYESNVPSSLIQKQSSSVVSTAGVYSPPLYWTYTSSKLYLTFSTFGIEVALSKNSTFIVNVIVFPAVNTVLSISLWLNFIPSLLFVVVGVILFNRASIFPWFSTVTLYSIESPGI